MSNRIKTSVFLSGLRTAWYLFQLKRNQWRSPQALQNIQLKRLKDMVNFAYANSPYYRKLFNAAGFNPRDLKSLDDIQNIPVTTKQDVRRNFSEIIATGTDQSACNIYHTSGSTGIPISILRDKKAQDYCTALKAYAFMECGVRLTDRFVTVGPSEKTPSPYMFCLPATADQDAVIHGLKQLKPDVLYSYSNTLSLMTGQGTSGIHPRLIFSQGMNLSQDCRARLKSAFGVDVFDTYGSREFGRLAFECKERSGLHMITDSYVIEFLKEGVPVSYGEPGQVVVTALYNFSMPFIRYQIDDIAVPTDAICSCGRHWPMIQRIEGRSVDFFTMPSGKTIHPGFIYPIINKETATNIFCILQLQIVQTHKDKIVIKIVKGSQFEPALLDRLENRITNTFKEMGEKVTVTMSIVNEIKKEKTGKIRTIISSVG